MIRFQLRTAASRAHSSGLDQRWTGSSDAMPTPASAHAFFSDANQGVVRLGVPEEGDEVRVGGQLDLLVAQVGDHAGEVEQRVVVVERGRVLRDLHRRVLLRPVTTGRG